MMKIKYVNALLIVYLIFLPSAMLQAIDDPRPIRRISLVVGHNDGGKNTVQLSYPAKDAKLIS